MRHSANRLKHRLRHGVKGKKKGDISHNRSKRKKYTLNKQLFPTMAVSDLTKDGEEISPQTYKYLFPIMLDMRMQ